MEEITRDDLAEMIQNIKKETGWKIRKMARETGMSYSTLQRYIQKVRFPKNVHETVKSIQGALTRFQRGETTQEKPEPVAVVATEYQADTWKEVPRKCLLCREPLQNQIAYCDQHYALWHFFYFEGGSGRRFQQSIHEALRKWVMRLSEHDIKWIQNHYWKREKEKKLDKII